MFLLTLQLGYFDLGCNDCYIIQKSVIWSAFYNKRPHIHPFISSRKVHDCLVIYNKYTYTLMSPCFLYFLCTRLQFEKNRMDKSFINRRISNCLSKANSMPWVKQTNFVIILFYNWDGARRCRVHIHEDVLTFHSANCWCNTLYQQKDKKKWGARFKIHLCNERILVSWGCSYLSFSQLLVQHIFSRKR